LNRKQKKLPVKIGVCGETRKYPVYKDIRIRTLGRVVGFAESEKILGLSCFCDHIIQNPGVLYEIKKRNLVLSTWGEDDNKEEIRKKQREMGVDVLCFDRLVISTTYFFSEQHFFSPQYTLL
jgi:glycerophosphoryl diester phosphodiesterase